MIFAEQTENQVTTNSTQANSNSDIDDKKINQQMKNTIKDNGKDFEKNIDKALK